VEPGDLISPARAALAAIGVRGEIVETPGHSEDSISLVLDDGTAFIGDLHTPDYADEDSYPVVVESWRLLLKAGAKVCYHSHRGAFNVEGLLGLLE
jgi:glyoxylase-like metal-dependent hydrolase (beta-lactamase superfamily II)